MPGKRPRRALSPDLAALRSESELERATREMFTRWGEWRVAAPEDAERARVAIETAERAYAEARERVLATTRTQMPPDIDALRKTVSRLTTILAKNDVPPAEVVGLLEGRLARDLAGEPIPGLGTAHWRHIRPRRGVDVLELTERDGDGRVLARVSHETHSPAPRWTCAVWDDADGALVWRE